MGDSRISFGIHQRGLNTRSQRFVRSVKMTVIGVKSPVLKVGWGLRLSATQWRISAKNRGTCKRKGAVVRTEDREKIGVGTIGLPIFWRDAREGVGKSEGGLTNGEPDGWGAAVGLVVWITFFKIRISKSSNSRYRRPITCYSYLAYRPGPNGEIPENVPH